jgi:hypothetical protein
MSQQLSNLFLSIGKPVKDEYGRSVGKIIASPLPPTESLKLRLSNKATEDSPNSPWSTSYSMALMSR